MGLISELGYEVKEANALQRVTQKVAASRPQDYRERAAHRDIEVFVLVPRHL